MKPLLLIIAMCSALLAAAPKPETKQAEPPAINTAKFWRLVAQAQAARQQANQTPQAKAADSADEAVKREQDELAKACGQKFILGYDQDEKSKNYQDITCLPKPDPKPEPKKPEPPPAKGK